MQPKIIILCLLLLVTANSMSQGADQSSGLKVMIDIPEICDVTGSPVSPRTLSSDISDPHFRQHFNVALENVSSQTIVLDRVNGIFLQLYFEVTDKDNKTTEVPQSVGAFAATHSDAVRLSPGQTTVVEIYRVWGNEVNLSGNFEECPWYFPFPERGQSRTVKIRAVFDAERLGTQGDQGSWRGKAVSNPMKSF